jgi:geranylgeranyl diphosphate synthase type I
MQIEAELKAFKQRLDPKIGAYFDSVIADVAKEDDLVADAIGNAKEIVLSGGKRLRAAFMYYGYLGAGGTEEEKILDASISVELIHAFLLVHDDIIDRDEIRHGVPTLHRRYEEFAKKHFSGNDAVHFGESVALILGDMLNAFGNDIIFRAAFPPERVLRALSRLQGIVSSTVIGQARDVYIEYMRKASEEEILRMYRNKTAKYTVEGPLHLGAILAGAPEELYGKISAYAVPLGTAFQIQDDILGVFGSEERIGKPVGSDIVEGKITLLVSRALRDGTAAQARRIREILLLGDRVSIGDVEEFRGILEETGEIGRASCRERVS